MATTEEKFSLILEATRLCLKQEFRGNLLTGHQPKVSIVVEKDPGEQDGSVDTITRIRLVYPNDKVGDPCNWDGMGRSVDEALTSNLWALEFEIEERLQEYQAMLLRVKEAASTK